MKNTRDHPRTKCVFHIQDIIRVNSGYTQEVHRKLNGYSSSNQKGANIYYLFHCELKKITLLLLEVVSLHITYFKKIIYIIYCLMLELSFIKRFSPFPITGNKFKFVIINHVRRQHMLSPYMIGEHFHYGSHLSSQYAAAPTLRLQVQRLESSFHPLQSWERPLRKKIYNNFR